jgi:hypothetical protein
MKNEPNGSVSQALPKPAAPPVKGVPYDFNKLLDTIMVPRVVARDPRLSPGAALLWGVIRQRTNARAWCRTPNKVLARELGVSAKQVQRYICQLTKAGLLHTISNPGEVPKRILLRDDRFDGTLPAASDYSKPGRITGAAKAKTPAATPRTDMSRPQDIKVPTPGQIRPPLRNGVLSVHSRSEKYSGPVGEGEDDLTKQLAELRVKGRQTTDPVELERILSEYRRLKAVQEALNGATAE